MSTGFASLDQALPGRGWPRAGLIEILVSRLGVGELYLLLPVLATLTNRPSARWCAWIAPPFEPFAPALTAHGIALEHVFITRGDSPLWAFEQSLRSGACDAVLGWAGKNSGVRAPASRRIVRALRSKAKARELRSRDIRRLHLAAEKGRALGVLFRPHQAASEASSAVLRMVVEPAKQGARVTLLKSRGGHRGSIDLKWPASSSFSSQPLSSHPSPQAHGSL
jgi:cell division inhibitor SulA